MLHQEKYFTLLQKLNKVSHCVISRGRDLKTLRPMKNREDLAMPSLIFRTVSKIPEALSSSRVFIQSKQ